MTAVIYLLAAAFCVALAAFAWIWATSRDPETHDEWKRRGGRDDEFRGGY